jgi:hypothetical protein
MGRVALDMGSLIPFGESVEDDGGVDEAGNQTAKQNRQEDEEYRRCQTETLNRQILEK